MKDNQNVLDEYNEENNPLPASFEIKTEADIKNIADSIQDMPGVAQIVTYINANPYELYLQNKQNCNIEKYSILYYNINVVFQLVHSRDTIKEIDNQKQFE